MNILAVGDIVGQIGIKELQKKLQKIKQEYNVDFVIVNGENAAEGMGITEKNFKDILSAGADCVTMGNHTWGKKEIFNFIDDICFSYIISIFIWTSYCKRIFHDHANLASLF